MISSALNAFKDDTYREGKKERRVMKERFASGEVNQ
jgi:hypothetical protein